MNARICLTAQGLKWLAPVLALALLAGAAYAVDRVLFPQDAPYPFYAIGLGHSGTTPDDWVVTAFCYPPNSFKAKYDLFDQPVPPSLLPDEPGYLEGFSLIAGGPLPTQVVLHNAPGAEVPIWFTPVSEWNGTWTVSEMKKQGSLRGWAVSFQSVEEPVDPSDPHGWWHKVAEASGVLEDGRSFSVHSGIVYMYGNFKDAQYNVSVRFGE